MKAVAVVLASGSGQRFGDKALPKHLTHVLEIPVLIWTLNTAIRSKLFSSIVVVTRKNDLVLTKKKLEEYFAADIINLRIAEGSSERMQSFLMGLEDLTKSNLVSKETIVALLDANRPFTPMNQLKDLYEATLEFGCSCPARPLVSGVARMDIKRISEVPDKSTYFEFVTPEFMRLSDFNESFEKRKEDFSSLVEYALALGIKPMTLDASTLNTKLTYPEDKTYLDGVALDNQLEKPCKHSNDELIK
ncbi:2-C-methyl-D-erythritol 4-phosphate cytidylyltransferase [Candidatus Thioglobus sp.]|nr:2-C-methyl-D-erythritol 4-phosphate cytidylyltransferase [Candidatus Thioglobus sp.]